MGRTSQIVETPVVKTLKWKNEKIFRDPKTKETKVERETGWYYFDKSLNDGEGDNVKVDMPISFIWLETASSIMGFNEKLKKSVWSNEVLDTKSQVLTVRVDKDVEAEGLYQAIKDEVKGIGGKFCSAVYALVDVADGEKEVWRFLMSGSSNSAWISFNKRVKNKTHKIVCFDTLVKYTPAGTSYEEPVFKYMPLTEAESIEADSVYIEQIEPYFDYMLNKPKEAIVKAEVDEDDDNY